MKLLGKLFSILEESKCCYEEAVASSFIEVERQGRGQGILASGNNLEFMTYLIKEKGMSSKIQFIYVDPPFFTKRNFKSSIKISSNNESGESKISNISYEDSWNGNMEDYLKMMCTRLYAMRELLAHNGIICVHLDWHAVHYVKIMMDEIFGEKNLINEIIWQYKSGGSTKSRFSRKHDTILMYAKSSKYKFNPLVEKSYNRGLKPYRFKGVEEYCDEIGWYTLVNMKDVWQIDMVGRTSKERTGYATQKPKALIERLLEACTDEGDLCADFFCGSGTLAAVANGMNRNWICCDIGEEAISSTQKRIADSETGYTLLQTINNESIRDFHVKISPLKECEKDIEECWVKLESYLIKDISKLNLNSQDAELIRQILQEDSLKLIDYWSIDSDYNGNIHCPDKIMRRENGKIEIETIIKIRQCQKISVRVVDIFGGSVMRVIK